ncbi:bifunctional diaminohydroxyphosphoribosylaminopyrimidine deaminase/5-amino-6-(5-phosphoribosylamino)uracil reductase RibD [Ruicaihuangia caeni]|uniref:Riboflavin biosynthesis protein RibD n=1 Tax=Ruicaihuangia caeni TaxID=3042517 RepID=A0AAW6T738_9MICO|nr:bifunctional diaminohydroxyphosphoribosylaminopyrimidine deaminase/5-amino-6-(5-phosphoribosylamino)uracil reductase RibD [Klugiella sp. YN-L-19]MDI2099329.1 bifunctional diaminohydroxyphosphoribosylaminopyrimidine deaminase/5-amino-6-(5-phosphoribosylamino)uracil reductase RibD [Klugiella sp. YN-L-19]
MISSRALDEAMRHALSLAAHGPTTGGNPQVGCVLLDESGVMVAEGWHRGAGTPHAETDALSRVADAAGLTAVVTLEPCNHTGRTGPCAQALIDAGVRRVVFALSDPGQDSAGGADRLRAAGVEVIAGVLEAEASEFLTPWLVAAARRRPWVTAKWASTLDGRIAAADGTSRWITGTAARQHVHEQRAGNDAIMVGTGTVLADDPALTARGDAGELLERQPLPVVLGEREVPADARLRQHPLGFIQFATRDLASALDDLWRRDVGRVYVEGGPTLISAAISAGLVDEYHIYLSPMLLGGPRHAVGDLGITTMTDALRLHLRDFRRLGDDIVVMARTVPGPTHPSLDRGDDVAHGIAPERH